MPLVQGFHTHLARPVQATMPRPIPACASCLQPRPCLSLPFLLFLQEIDPIMAIFCSAYWTWWVCFSFTAVPKALGPGAGAQEVSLRRKPSLHQLCSSWKQMPSLHSNTLPRLEFTITKAKVHPSVCPSDQSAKIQIPGSTDQLSPTLTYSGLKWQHLTCDSYPNPILCF